MKKIITWVLAFMLLLPSTSFAQKKSTIGMLILGAALSGADTAQSISMLSSGQVREVNPVLRPFTSNPALYGGVKTGTDIAVILWINSMRKDHPKRAFALAATFVGIKALVVYNNVRVNRQLQGK
jgi:hypothetical protein